MTIKDRVSKQLETLNVSRSRIPYTYHHDYIRGNIFVKISRADIARVEVDDDHLWACCLLQAVSNLTDEEKISSGIDVDLYKECMTLAEDALDQFRAQVYSVTLRGN